LFGVLLGIVEVGFRRIVVHLMVHPVQLVQTPHLNIVANNSFLKYFTIQNSEITVSDSKTAVSVFSCSQQEQPAGAASRSSQQEQPAGAASRSSQQEQPAGAAPTVPDFM
jgi:hypothetical protein